MIRRLVGVVALSLSLVGTSACTGSSSPQGRTGTAPSTVTSSPHTSPAPSRPASTPRLEQAVDTVRRAHPDAEIGVAFAPVGTTAKVRFVGEPTTLVAWSTIKVPLALAVIRAGNGHSSSDDIRRALTASDNEAAARLWDHLGDGDVASAAVERQLRRGGDRRTRVPPQVTVPGYSPFGQATWRLTDQTRFTAALPCLSGSAAVTDDMSHVVDGQRWGLGGMSGAKYKGGWGSTPDGYVVRQLGLVPAKGAKGATAVTLQVRTGTHGQGTGIADELVAALRTNRDELPVGTCS